LIAKVPSALFGSPPCFLLVAFCHSRVIGNPVFFRSPRSRGWQLFSVVFVEVTLHFKKCRRLLTQSVREDDKRKASFPRQHIPKYVNPAIISKCVEFPQKWFRNILYWAFISINNKHGIPFPFNNFFILSNFSLSLLCKLIVKLPVSFSQSFHSLVGHSNHLFFLLSKI